MSMYFQISFAGYTIVRGNFIIDIGQGMNINGRDDLIPAIVIFEEIVI